MPTDRGLVFDQVVSGIGAPVPSGSAARTYPATEIGALSFLSASNSYVFRVPDRLIFPATEFDGSSILAPADLVAASSDATVEVRRNQCTPGISQVYSHSLLLYRQGSPGSRIAIAFSSIARYTYGVLTRAAGAEDTFFVGYGSPTPSAQLPGSGTVTYRGEAIVTGYLREVAFNEDFTAVADVTVTVDYLAGTYRASVDLSRVGRAGSPTTTENFGVLTFDNAGSPGLSRLRSSQNGGSALGFVSGPSADEVVMAFTFTRPVTRAMSMNFDVSFAGSLVARR